MEYESIDENDIILPEIVLHNLDEVIENIPLPEKIDAPSLWSESNIYLTKDVSSVDGKFSLDLTPYWREPLDCAHPSHPAKIIFILKSGQTGCTQCVIVPIICWKIAQNPGNMMVTSGNEKLSKEVVATRIDPAIKSAGIQNLVRSNVIKKKNAKTGDTDEHKQFAGGNAFFCSIGSVDTVGKQKALETILADDFSASKLADKKQGNTFDILQQRQNTYEFTRKGYYISTPETRPDPTEIGYLKGDQRKYHMPCPCDCGAMIPFVWSIEIDGTRCGVIYDTEEGKLVKGSVKYKCPNCFGEFPESEKFRMMKKGKWIPTATPEQEYWYSYHISALYGAPNMMSWDSIVLRWLEIFETGKCDSDKLKTFMNLIMGEAFEDETSDVSSQEIMNNMPGYEVATVPDALSNRIGCGDIMFLTGGVDLGGTEDDARLDYEIVAWTENGQNFSITQGSIGTYSPSKREQAKDRIKWTYRFGYEYCVWDELTKIMGKAYQFDEGNMEMPVSMVCIDTGYMPDSAKTYISLNHIRAVAIVGVAQKNGFNDNIDRPRYKWSSSEMNLINLQVDVIKNDVSRAMLKRYSDTQIHPYNLMLFPDPIDDKYRSNVFFRQLEGEHKVPQTDKAGKITSYVWEKKPGYQNHFLDARCYATGAMHIHIDDIMKTKHGKLLDYAEGYKKQKNTN